MISNCRNRTLVSRASIACEPKPCYKRVGNDLRDFGMLIGSSPAVEDALSLYDRGLAVIPVLKDDGKSPAGIVAGFGKWRRRLPRDRTAELFQQHHGANIAILPYLCLPRLVVVDCDDDPAFAAALE